MTHTRSLTRLIVSVGCGLAMIFATQPAFSQPRRAATDNLDTLLVELGERSGADLLFDQALVKGYVAKRPRAGLSTQSALRELLAATGLGYRRTVDGAYVLYRLPASDAAPAEPTLVPELLVIGKRLQNVDIRRTPNDVQPYRVLDASQIAASHRDNLDQLLRARLPGNADFRLGNLIDLGQVNSSVDLRGVGTDRTLVLVDGRRLPSMPDLSTFRQPDVNPVPLNAIERIETLTSTAGGIYGSGAIGGVVNIVLRREYRGIDLIATTGITDRGDAARMRLEGRFGVSTPDDRTKFMLSGSYETNDVLSAGQRDYSARARQIAYANDPRGYVVAARTGRSIVTNAVQVFSLAPFDSLVLKPEFGGERLGSDHSYLPIGFSGNAQDRANELLRNAGGVPLEFPEEGGGNQRNLIPKPVRAAAIFSTRRAIGDEGLELFVDGLFLHDRGVVQSGNIVRGTIGADAPGNPFAHRVLVMLPNMASSASVQTGDLGSLTAGAIMPIAGTWRASADLSVGRAVATTRFGGYNGLGGYVGQGLLTGQPISPEVAPLRPLLQDWKDFLQAIPSYMPYDESRRRQVNRSFGATARMGGPVARLAGGTAFLSLLAEARRDRVEAYRFDEYSPLTPALGRRDYSIYGELHAPLLPRDAVPAMLRGLELQLAARRDAQQTSLYADPDRPEAHDRHTAMFTAGAKVHPWTFLTFRGAYATGSVMPSVYAFLSKPGAYNGLVGDPKRGGERITERGEVVAGRQGGNPDIQPETADTVSLGFVIDAGLRVSADYSRISIRKEINQSLRSIDRLVALEGVYPERVVRAALADEDRLKGYSAGKITWLDFSAGNFGRSIVHSIDVNIDWRFADPWGGTVAPYAAVTWQPDFRTRQAPGLPWVKRVGFADGPLEWRGNGGVVWTRGPASMDVNVQYLSGYKVINAVSVNAFDPQLEIFQGGERVPPQVYVDVAVSRRFTLARRAAIRTLEVRLGILNIFDRSPPVIADPGGRSFSAYGDPRRRRFDLVLAAKY